jgi:DNA-directed RNA polymerase subunit E'/Rpb7
MNSKKNDFFNLVMSEICIIEKKVCLKPEFLSKDYKKYLLDEIKKTFKNECSKEIGYILDIVKIKSIKDNYISSNCEIVLIVEVLVKVLKPEINKIFQDKVCMIFSGGIFLDIKEKFKVLIPQNSLLDYTFDSKTKSFVKDDIQISEGDIIKVKITGFKYNKNNFSCFGELLTI